MRRVPLRVVPPTDRSGASLKDVAKDRTCADCGAPISRHAKARCVKCSAVERESRKPLRSAICLECGERFEWQGGSPLRCYCSRKCNNRARGKKGARVGALKRAAERVGKVCEICGAAFSVPPSRARAKVCSLKCAHELKRRQGGAYRRGTLNPAYKDGLKMGTGDQEIQAHWRQTMTDQCRNPACRRQHGRLVHHHIVYRQHVRRAGGNVWDPANGITLCDGCHMAHHGRAQKLPLSALPTPALRYAFDLFGSAASLYLRRYYQDDGDPRMDDIASEYVGR